MLTMLLERLQHPEPAVRIQTLRVLAMVEETEALQAVAAVYQGDPHPDVKKTAYWAGRILYAAHKRGHSTQRALHTQFGQTADAEREANFLRDTVAETRGSGGNALQDQLRLEQDLLRHELTDTLHGSRAGSAEPSLNDLAADMLGDDDFANDGFT